MAPEFVMSLPRLTNEMARGEAEPLAALVPLSFAFVGEATWHLAGLAYSSITVFLKRWDHRAENPV